MYAYASCFLVFECTDRHIGTLRKQVKVSDRDRDRDRDRNRNRNSFKKSRTV